MAVWRDDPVDIIDPEDFYYNKKTGKLYRVFEDKVKWLHRLNSCGYLHFSYHNKDFYVARVVWLLEKGCWPKEIDHINKKKTDNRIENLRECTHGQNMTRNSTKNKTGYRGVTKMRNKYRAEIGHKQTKDYGYLGLFNTKEEAALAYNEAALKKYGKEFAVLNEIKDK